MDSINDIISSLSNDDIEMLKGVASSIIGDNGGNGGNSPLGEDANSAQQNNSNTNSQNPFQNLNLNQSDLNMILKAKSLFDKMNSTPSKNADLIMALKPHLSEGTQNKADQAVKILKLFEVLPLLKDLF